MKTNVVVVIPNWNGEDFIAECLASLKEQSLKHDVLVVDNGSVDRQSKLLNHLFQMSEFSASMTMLVCRWGEPWYTPSS